MSARVLVVDDIPVNRRLLEAKLAAEFFEVTMAASGAEALAVAAQWSPDVILLDVMMPEMDGFETCRALKANPGTAHIPVVMVTALIDRSERVRGLEAGADDFLSKPVDDVTLFARLRALLRVKQVQDAWRLRAEIARQLGVEPPVTPEAAVAGSAVLVLADDAEAAEVGSCLVADGAVPALVSRPEEAEAALTTGRFDLAILCLPATGMEHLRFASRMKAQHATRDLPVLLVADPAQRDLVLRGFEIGASDYVLRPVDGNELRARARNQIRRRRYEERLRTDLDRSLELAVSDPLTGLRNRRFVQHHLEAALRAGDVAVMMIDVDRFKAINDGHGHAGGDKVLQEVAERLRSQLRAADVVARFGGEEFLVVLADAPPEEAVAIAERLRAALERTPIPTGQGEVSVTVSVGLAITPTGVSASEAIAAADVALYRAKSLGRNRVEVAPARAAQSKD
ncbi:PleD family two-component system response regulator [Craurococcus roseus]